MREKQGTVFVDCLSPGGLDDALLWRLAPEERRQRAKRYRNAADARRCLAAGILAERAARRMGFDGDIVIGRDAHGKPRLIGCGAPEFNLSHSGRWVVIGYGHSPLGVDVEQISPETDHAALARRYFSPHEQEYLCAAGEAERPLRFARLWTAKESYVKYLGCGLAKPLSSFTVDPVRGRILREEGDEEEVFLSFLVPDEEYALTVCSAAQNVELRLLSAEDITP